jgi:UDP-N-acetylglucosamine--N-acetylmuramyl-(pentapeptide) pyrophosphoryl-undecaprenol N-acetylglucosamine transferase
VIAAGGTAGHVVPAIAVADALRSEGARVSFIGTRERAEAELVPEAGYEIDFLDVSGLDRRNPLKAATAVLKSSAAVRRARKLLGERGADAVMGGGGYVAGPVGLAAVSAGLPLVLTEADSHLGLANRMLAGRAQRVCLAFPIEGREGERYLVTGRPVPETIGKADRRVARKRFGIDEETWALLVFGGSLGAQTINRAALDAFAGSSGPADGVHVIHVSGRRDYEESKRRLDQAGARDYTLLAYEPDLADVLAASDLVLARAGGSVFEIAAAGRPAILVPYPQATADHQSANARWMTEAGAAVTIPDDELTPARLADTTADLLGDAVRLDAMATASRRLARPDAARRVAAELLDSIPGGGG